MNGNTEVLHKRILIICNPPNIISVIDFRIMRPDFSKYGTDEKGAKVLHNRILIICNLPNIISVIDFRIMAPDYSKYGTDEKGAKGMG